MRAQLIPADGGPAIELVKDLSIVGRKDGSDVRVDHKSVSKQHCVIVKADGLLVVRDLGSTNGTRVNGQRVRRAALLPNDQVSFASIRFKVHLGAGEPLPTAGEHTVHMGVDDLPGLADKDDESRGPEPKMPLGTVKTNQLPDVYLDEPKPPDR
ncbi:MAG TPA: FHA domain-containing protein [Gemmataceae bacterium]|jgi:pSer/pThr/pTyr-binding forkhead associated (FHA) protein|nr:FHA domain-containing protein [Gemmataceae bacterium]